MVSFIFITLIALIWLTPTIFYLDDDAILANSIVQILLTIIVCLTASFIIYILYLIQRQTNSSEQNSTPLTFKENLKQQKAIFKKNAHEVFTNLKIAFQIWGNKKQRYLRKLPWYIVLGSHDSGKTTLLSNSGLDFSPTETLGPDPLQSNNTHSDYNWRFSKEAVILDIDASQDTTGSSENLAPAYWGINLHDPFWAGILKLIKRHRRQKPLNGAIVTFNLPELLLQAEKTHLMQKQALKSILQTIHQELKIQTPIYLIFTKCDLIAGFHEFFSDLSKEDIEQIWGIPFPAQASITQKQALDYFSQEFDKLIARLQERLLLRLELERDASKRLLISYFPQQMQLCKQLLTEFVLQDENAQIRGIYFISNLQNGKPYNFLLSALAAKYNLTVPQLNSIPLQNKSYFTQRLFKYAILPEADWVTNSPYLQRIRNYSYRASWAIAIFAVLFSLIGLSTSYAKNKTSTEEIQRYLPEYRQAISNLEPTDKAVTDALPLLNIVSNIQTIYSNTNNKWLLYFELYQPLKISKTLDNIWQRTLSNQLMTRVAIRLENILKLYQNNPEILYQTLKGYLVFSPTANTDSRWLLPPITYDAINNLKLHPDEQAQIKAYLSDAINYPVDAIPLNQKLIEQTREQLRKVNPVEFAYYELKQESINFAGLLNLENKLGPVFTNIFTFRNNVKTIPTLYTLWGYKDLHGKKSTLLIKHTAEIYWILGLDKMPDGSDLVAVMTPTLWSHYNTDYINNWDAVLNDIEITSFNNLSQAIQALDLLTGSHSPLLSLLDIVKANTYTVRGKNLHIAQHYNALNIITGLPGKPNPQYTILLKNLTALRDYLASFNSSANTAQLEFQEASAYLQNKSPNNPIAILKKQAQQMPAPLNRWLNEIADSSFNVILQGARQTINTAWQNNVLPTYQTNIQGRFPFNSQSDAFVSMTGFGDFFGINGTFEQFYQTYLAPFVDSSQTPWRQKQVGNYSLGIAKNVIAQLEKAALIHNMYFQNGNQTSLIQFAIKPRFLDPQSSSIYLQLANQNLTYQHGPQQTLNWKWPIPTDSQQVNVTFNDFQGQNYSRTFDGPWAWFKLLNDSQIQTIGTPGHYIWTIKQDKHQASFDLWTSNNMPLFDLQQLESFSLPGSI